MFGSTPYGASAYSKVGIETGVASASPHKLIVMLYDGAILAISKALQQMKSGNIAEKGSCISKAILIIDSGLRASLDIKAGGEIAQNLDSLYEYMCNQLFQANLKNQPELLDEVYTLLIELKGAWEAIDDSKSQNTETQTQQSIPAAYDALSPRTSSLVRA